MCMQAATIISSRVCNKLTQNRISTFVIRKNAREICCSHRWRAKTSFPPLRQLYFHYHALFSENPIPSLYSVSFPSSILLTDFSNLHSQGALWQSSVCAYVYIRAAICASNSLELGNKEAATKKFGDIIFTTDGFSSLHLSWNFRRFPLNRHSFFNDWVTKKPLRHRIAHTTFAC